MVSFLASVGAVRQADAERLVREHHLMQVAPTPHGAAPPR